MARLPAGRTLSLSPLRAVQQKAEVFVQNYCMSDMGLTTYAQVKKIDTTFREGKVEVADLLAAEQLEAVGQPGTLPPRQPMHQRLEVRPSGLPYSIVFTPAPAVQGRLAVMAYSVVHAVYVSGGWHANARCSGVAPVLQIGIRAHVCTD